VRALATSRSIPPRARAAGIVLSPGAQDILQRTLERALGIVAELEGRVPVAEGLEDASTHLLEVFESPLVQTGRAGPLSLDPNRRLTLKCVFAWAAREATPAVRRELRRFARLMGVTR
jgi:hypothetical protein